ncbi:hypothetical protein J2Y38_002034 [Flavobacterium sp. 2755]|uniref:hypothetical protein n=1 Tax=Flavobacterium sp. 2755 TaxID=2817765 RepID=UPI00285991E6|nr:hypothetical protein [Flavobacterium sp. 2755]MDR6761825.1 hypothetical protein [Flavobacterium sp. 2755]
MPKSNLEFWIDLLTYILPFLQLLILVIPFLGERPLFDLQRDFWNIFSKRGYAILFLGALLTYFTIKQSIVTKDLAVIDAQEVKDAEIKRDKYNQAKIDSASQKTNEMLAKYGFKVDSKNEEIVKILQDPNLKKLTIVNGESPLLSITDVIFDKENKNKLTFKIRSFDASSYDLNLRLDIFGLTNNDKDFILLTKDFNLFGTVNIVNKDQSLELYKEFNFIKSYNVLYFRLHGTYEKYDGTLIPIDNYAMLNKSQNDGKLQIPTLESVNQIKIYLNTRGLK